MRWCFVYDNVAWSFYLIPASKKKEFYALLKAIDEDDEGSNQYYNLLKTFDDKFSGYYVENISNYNFLCPEED